MRLSILVVSVLASFAGVAAYLEQRPSPPVGAVTPGRGVEAEDGKSVTRPAPGGGFEIDPRWNAILEVRNTIKAGKGYQTSHVLSPDERTSLRAILSKGEEKFRAGEPLTERERYDLAVVVIRLVSAGEAVADSERWLDSEFFKALHETLEKRADALLKKKEALEEEFHLARDNAALLLQEANKESRVGDLDKAIRNYRDYVSVAEKLTTSDSPQESKDGLTAARKRLGLTLIARANGYDRRGMADEANKDRAAALEIWDELKRGIAGSSLDIIPGDENDRSLLRWFLRTTVGHPKAEVRSEGGFTYFWMHDEDSSFSFTRLIVRDKADDVCLRWRWKLDKMPPEFKKDGFSVNHPLGVVVAFLRDDKALRADNAKYRDRPIVALHYIWESTKGMKLGERWIDPDSDTIKMGLFEYKTIYPHIVAATTEDTLEKWITGQADIGADYRHFFGEAPPPVRAVVVHTNCQYGAPGEARLAEGGIGALEFVAKVDGKCPELKP